ncbi:MAG: hypothetical protein J2P21_17780 [Chloracidobacterium sp.]|nr:hypothetical protein [Chloracidobacterium sp.]
MAAVDQVGQQSLGTAVAQGEFRCNYIDDIGRSELNAVEGAPTIPAMAVTIRVFTVPGARSSSVCPS